MNIIAKTYKDSICCRPDTTWERENRDFYSPDCAGSIYWTPVIFARICKAGKCVGSKFVSRYHDGMNFGSFLYIGDLLPDIAAASCADHTSILPFPLYNPVVFDKPGNSFLLTKDGKPVFGCTVEGMTKKIEDAICEASVLTSLRIGDVVAVELAAPQVLSTREEKECAIAATFCDNDTFDFNIIW
ncbi:MAG: hypothetical protein ACI3ZL_04055 [Candidatus Cryptobacteroides sp.]